MDERSTELAFRAVSLSDYDTAQPYLYAHGEGSCQHSFVSMYALSEKYGDEICEKDGFLYTLRSRLCDEAFRVYLAPMGEGERKAAYQNILNDAPQFDDVTTLCFDFFGPEGRKAETETEKKTKYK